MLVFKKTEVEKVSLVSDMRVGQTGQIVGEGDYVVMTYLNRLVSLSRPCRVWDQPTGGMKVRLFDIQFQEI